MPNIGRYANGDHYVENPSSGSGIECTAISPAGAVAASVVTLGDGTQTNIVTNGATTTMMQDANDIDQAMTDLAFGGSSVAYDGSKQKDPGLSGSPIQFPAGSEGTIVKSVFSDADPVDAKNPLKALANLTVVANPPALGSFRPGIASSSKASPFNESQLISMASLPKNAIITGNPSKTSLLGALRWMQNTQYGIGDTGRYMNPSMNAPGEYPVRDIAPNVSAAVLMLCQDIPDADKRDLAVAICQIAIDADAYLTARATAADYGGTNGISGLGGVSQYNFKLALAAASILLGGDAGLRATSQTTQFSVDGQLGNVTQAMIDGTQTEISGRPLEQYTQDDLGMPEWFSSNILKGDIGNAHRDTAYRAICAPHYVQLALAIHVFPGLAAIWQNQSVLDYADRIMERDFFSVPGARLTANKWARTLDGIDSLTPWEELAWDTWRSQGAAIWDWS